MPSGTSRGHRAAVAVIIMIVGVSAGLIYWFFDPSTSYFPRCPIYMITGWQCPGCGSQRAIHALLNGDIAAAWRFNAMLLVLLPIIAVILVAELFRNRLPRFNRAVTSPLFVVMLVVGIALWWVLRNLT